MYQYYDVTTSPSSVSVYDTAGVGLSEGATIWVGIAAIISLVCGILLYCLFVKSKETPKGKFLKWLKDFLSFKIMWIEPILKTVYYIATIFVVLFSFSFLSTGSGNGVILWLMCLILGPIAIRLTYEITMMFIMIWRNTRDIAENTKKK